MGEYDFTYQLPKNFHIRVFSTLNSLIKEVLQKHFNDVNMNMKMLDLLIMQD